MENLDDYIRRNTKGLNRHDKRIKEKMLINQQKEETRKSVRQKLEKNAGDSYAWLFSALGIYLWEQGYTEDQIMEIFQGTDKTLCREKENGYNTSDKMIYRMYQLTGMSLVIKD